jgi:hypothetical protein
MLHSSHTVVDYINRIISCSQHEMNIFGNLQFTHSIDLSAVRPTCCLLSGPKYHNHCLSEICTFCPPIHIFSLSNMGNSTDKEKKKTAAKRQSAAAAKAKPPTKAKHARKLTSKAASRKNHMQDDTDSSDEGGGGEDGEDGGDDLQEDIESVFCSQHKADKLLTFDHKKLERCCAKRSSYLCDHQRPDDQAGPFPISRIKRLGIERWRKAQDGLSLAVVSDPLH